MADIELGTTYNTMMNKIHKKIPPLHDLHFNVRNNNK